MAAIIHFGGGDIAIGAILFIQHIDRARPGGRVVILHAGLRCSRDGFNAGIGINRPPIGVATMHSECRKGDVANFAGNLTYGAARNIGGSAFR